MSNSTIIDHPRDTAVSDALTDLALDLRWSFNHSADQLWDQLDPELWELTHNPWVLLQTVSREKLQTLTSDPGFQKLLADLHREKVLAEESEAWFQKAHPRSGVSTIACFSMEFMLSEALPIYSGGLGNVAGDQLKAASNLGVPVTGIGLLYQQGYFRQEIDAQGRQQPLYPFNDPGQLPIRPVREPNDEWLRLAIALPGFKLWIRIWQVQVGMPTVPWHLQTLRRLRTTPCTTAGRVASPLRPAICGDSVKKSSSTAFAARNCPKCRPALVEKRLHSELRLQQLQNRLRCDAAATRVQSMYFNRD